MAHSTASIMKVSDLREGPRARLWAMRRRNAEATLPQAVFASARLIQTTHQCNFTNESRREREGYISTLSDGESSCSYEENLPLSANRK
jgi:hypothetical protein